MKHSGVEGNSESTSSRPTDTGYGFLNPVIEKALTPSIFNHPPSAPRTVNCSGIGSTDLPIVLN